MFKLIEASPECLQIPWVATRQSYNFKPPGSPVWEKTHRRQLQIKSQFCNGREKLLYVAPSAPACAYHWPWAFSKSMLMDKICWVWTVLILGNTGNQIWFSLCCWSHFCLHIFCLSDWLHAVYLREFSQLYK